MSTRSTSGGGGGGGGGTRRGRGHKERSKNFTELEKRTVLELIARHRDVLKQGRSNNATNKNKQLVWSTICEEVNLRCGGERPRTPAQVKMWYENYKKKCKMRAADPQQPQEGSGLLDGMLWQNIHPLDVKDDEQETMENGSVNSAKEDDLLPVNMSNGRLSSCNESNDGLPNVLEPHVQIIPQSSPTPPPKIHTSVPIQTLHNHIIMNPLAADFRQKSFTQENAPLNLSHLDSDAENRKSISSDDARRVRNKYVHESKEHNFRDESSATEEERLYYTAKRQHAIWEHEAKMRILNMELRQKEEIFSLQKQLFLIELKLKMDFLEKACAK